MFNKGILLSFPIFCLMLPVATALPATWYVDGSVSAAGNGETWQTAFKTIREGIEAAADGDIVIVADGLYLENIQFNGKNITLRSTDPSASSVVNNTIIEGLHLGPVVTFGGTEDESCVLAGFTIRHGRAPQGGGIYGGEGVSGTRATIRNNVISENLATLDGGGLCGCRGSIEENMITGNIADRQGGGVYRCGGEVRDNTISDNTARDGGGLAYCGGTIENNSVWNNSAAAGATGSWCHGGGLYECDGTIRDNLISGNSSALFGGGLAQCDGLIENNTITGNQAEGYGAGLFECSGTIRGNTITVNWTDGSGGGLFRCDGTIEDNLISGNDAGAGGGFYSCHGTILNNVITANRAGTGGGLCACHATVEGNTISRNYAGAGGGAYACSGTVLSNVFSGNVAERGPGGGLDHGYGRIEGNLIVGNSAMEEGGGLVISQSAVANNTIVGNVAKHGGGLWANDRERTAIRNCIFWGNKADESGDQMMSKWWQPPPSDVTYCCLQDWTRHGEGNIADDPQFVDPDGPDDDPDTWEDNDYRLSPDSPCIDTGLNEDWMWDAADLKGDPRICRAVASLTVDMGAYEYFRSSIVEVLDKAQGEMEITWTSRPEDVYTVWSCTDLLIGGWQKEDTVSSQGTRTSWTHTAPLVRNRFYRVGGLE